MRLSAFAIPIITVSTAFALSKSSRPYRRTLVQDVCGSLNSDLVLNDVRDNHGKPTVAGHLEACLCLSDIGNFVQSNAVAQTAVKLLAGNHAKVEAIISGMIQVLPDSQCTYPDHSRAVCTDADPCGFQCADGYLAFPPERPTTCRCPDHLMECDGKCGHFKECPTSAPPSRRRSEPHCAPGLAMCGTPGPSTGQPWKCVNVNTDPTTCGGCVQAAPFGSAPVGGPNCREMEGVNPSTVACGEGHCIVNDCVEGFIISPTRDSCIPRHQSAIASSKGSAADGVKGSRDELPGGQPGIASLPIGGAAVQGAGASTPVDKITRDEC